MLNLAVDWRSDAITSVRQNITAIWFVVLNYAACQVLGERMVTEAHMCEELVPSCYLAANWPGVEPATS